MLPKMSHVKSGGYALLICLLLTSGAHLFKGLSLELPTPPKKSKDLTSYSSLLSSLLLLRSFYISSSLLNLLSSLYLKSFAKKITLLSNATFLILSLQPATSTQPSDEDYILTMLLGLNLLCLFFGPGGSSPKSTTKKCPCKGTDTCSCGPDCTCGAPKSAVAKCPCKGTETCGCGVECECGAPKA
ncbi:hypothetical protein TrVE_jg6429 [Triparma verrucosa]|uniref:Uncharacterized protein n=2 Tax=Triparma TaxID=722752 RepID=A0A9W7BGD5_9STRA|nr:hypothetical protein TrST_g13439 [Triparma strigata]GMI08815.1 hypothetical protein TrVE_jg6429 [Triparma verrucosa]